MTRGAVCWKRALKLPEWASLVRLTTDELVLIAYYRSCHIPEVKESVYDFARISAESCKDATASNVIALPPGRKKKLIP
jgi:hypothetical protein